MSLQEDMITVGVIISKILSNPNDETVLNEIKQEAQHLCAKYSIYEGVSKGVCNA